MNEMSSSPFPVATMAMVRQAVLFLGGLAVGRGWVRPEDLDGLATMSVTLMVAGYGLYKTFSRQRRLKDAEATLRGPIPKGGQ